MTTTDDRILEAQRDEDRAGPRKRAKYVSDRTELFLKKRAAINPGGLLELVRERLQTRDEKEMLARARAGRPVCWTESDDETEPLVTVRVATYNRGPLVVERAITSALSQTYPAIEVLVVGDHCDDATERAVLSVEDPRVRFVNLPRRGLYPTRKEDLWMVGGVHPMNAALQLAKGHWIAPCDDDDELTETHVEQLLAHAKSHSLEMVYSKAAFRSPRGTWHAVGRLPLKNGHISHGAVMYSSGLSFIRHSDTCWKLREPADWNMWKRMERAGVRIGFLDEFTYLHH